MGFVGRSVDRFAKANARHIDCRRATTDVSGTFGGLAKVLRMILQSAVLGVGA